jgi:hypothetical protein
MTIASYLATAGDGTAKVDHIQEIENRLARNVELIEEFPDRLHHPPPTDTRIRAISVLPRGFVPAPIAAQFLLA